MTNIITNEDGSNPRCIDCAKRELVYGGFLISDNPKRSIKIYKPFSYLFRIMWIGNQFINRHSRWRYTEQFIPKTLTDNQTTK
jgi:hypothetical protein